MYYIVGHLIRGFYVLLEVNTEYLRRPTGSMLLAREAADWALGGKARRASPASYAALVAGEAPW